jgi:hypothetical protein
MEVISKGRTIRIQSGQGFPFKGLFLDAAVVLILVWGIFLSLVFFFSQPGGVIFPYFIGITLLLLIPLITGILIRHARHYRDVFFDDRKRMLSIKGLWRRHLVSYNDISCFKINTSRYKDGSRIYRLETVLSSGKTLQLIQDVPDKEAICDLGKKVGDLIKKPFNLPD